MDGYNVTIFAYGQTGSGKTHTMAGTHDNPGVNIRALRELFGVSEERKEDYRTTIRYGPTPSFGWCFQSRPEKPPSLSQPCPV